MSQIPSDIAASAAQAGFQAREIAADREARHAGQTHAATRRVKTVNDAGTTVETTDSDTQVFTEAEGQGGQGRQPDEQAPAQDNHVPPPPTPGIHADPDGTLHVDLEA